MSKPDAGPRPEALPEADKVTSLVTTARRLLAEQKMVDLSALDGRVSALCDSIRHVPPDDTAAVKAVLTDIVEDLDRLEAELTAQNEDVNAQTVNAARRQAMDAYAKTKDES
ncbi:MAG: hypothetical protein ACE5FR_08215 [Rhodospirillales bacterium]